MAIGESRHIDAARERVVLDRSATTLKPSEEAPACIRHGFELNWPTGLLLDHHGPRSQLTAGKVADPDLHQIATSRFAVDRKIEKRPVSKPMLSIQVKANSPNLPGL